MAGSPEYLHSLDLVLDTIAFSAVEGDQGGSWENVEARWQALAINPNEDTLFLLARTCYQRMTAMTGLTTDEIINTAKSLHIRKNAGYAGADNVDPWANFRLSDVFRVSPYRGVLVRMSDKWSRIVALRRDPNNEQVGESLLDTLADLAAYALIALCLLREGRPSTTEGVFGPS